MSDGDGDGRILVVRTEVLRGPRRVGSVVHILPVALAFKCNGVSPTVRLSYFDVGPLIEVGVDDLKVLVVNRDLNNEYGYGGGYIHQQRRL